jgi:hypothetical protein
VTVAAVGLKEAWLCGPEGNRRPEPPHGVHMQAVGVKIVMYWSLNDFLYARFVIFGWPPTHVAVMTLGLQSANQMVLCLAAQRRSCSEQRPDRATREGDGLEQ